MKKKKIEERREARERVGFDYPGSELYHRLASLRVAYFLHDEDNKELLKYFPIAFAACIESYFRDAIKALVDSDEKYLENARNLLKRLEFNFDIIAKLHGNDITVGDLSAASAPVTELERLDDWMSGLMDCNFLEEVSLMYERREPERRFFKNAEEIFRYVKRTFELRNIFCHESASGVGVDSEEINKCVNSCADFLKVSEDLIGRVLIPEVAIRGENAISSCRALCEKEKRNLDSLLEELSGLLSKEQKAKLAKANEAWGRFARASVEIEALNCDSPTDAELVRNFAPVWFLRRRKKQVTDMIDSLREQYSS